MLLEDAVPGGCHPALEQYATSLRGVLNQRRPGPSDVQVVLPIITERLTAERLDIDPGEEKAVGDSLRTRLPKYPPPRPLKTGRLILELQRAAGPAAYVGCRQWLWWWVYTDQFGRHVAGSRTFRHVQESWPIQMDRRWPRGIPRYWVPDDEETLAE